MKLLDQVVPPAGGECSPISAHSALVRFLSPPGLQEACFFQTLPVALLMRRDKGAMPFTNSDTGCQVRYLAQLCISQMRLDKVPRLTLRGLA